MRRPTLCLVTALALASACTKLPEEVEPAIFRTDAGDEMILIPAGEFDMGSAKGEADEAPAHRVRVSAFLMDRYEVTQKILTRLEFSDPSRFDGQDHPADNLTWILAAQLCNRRSEAEGLEYCYDPMTGACDPSKNGYRLPTEAEWEYVVSCE